MAKKKKTQKPISGVKGEAITRSIIDDTTQDEPTGKLTKKQKKLLKEEKRKRKEAKLRSKERSAEIGRGTTKWHETLAIDIYDYATRGWPLNQIAEALDVSPGTLNSWKKKHPTVAHALQKGKEKAEGYDPTQAEQNGQNALQNRVYQALPTHLQEYWDMLETADPSAPGLELANMQKMELWERQMLFLKAMLGNGYNASRACQMTGIPYTHYKSWCTRDQRFRDTLDIVKDHKKDFVEQQLMNLVEDGDRNAVIFANKTLNKDRGYGEKREVEVSGQVNHAHAHIDISKLDLEPDVLRKVLQAVDKHEEEMRLLDGETALIEAAISGS